MSFTAPSRADIDEFVGAMDTLRSGAGTTCLFTVPPDAIEWPRGTKINPDTGMPYDATVVPVNEPTTVAITVLIIAKQGSPLRPGAEQFWAEVGLMQGMDIILDVSNEDYAKVQAASQFTINGLQYEIVERKPFGIANTIYRFLVYGQEK